jgi:pimeloyl-ACP methyl ester carboxylesterase
MNLFTYTIAIATLVFSTFSLADKGAAKNEMLKVGDHALHTMSMGEGEFTVIFEAGFGSDLSHWRKVAPAISQQAKVVVYSRAGYGQSSPVTSARNLSETTRELGALIKAANLQAPFIFVGHSYGSHIIRSYAAQHPQDIAGLVFVDPANEAFLNKLKELDKAKTEAFLAAYNKMLPQKLRSESEILMAIDERGTLPNFGQLPDVPAAIITSMVQEHPQFIIHSKEGKKLWRALHSKLFSQFSTAQHITTMNSGHNIALQEPDLVIDAIQNVMQQAGRISQKNQLSEALSQAGKLIERSEVTQAENLIFSVLKNTALAPEKINTLGYQALNTKSLQLAAIILKYNVDNSPESANAFDSYGESLLALNRPEQAKDCFLEAIRLTENKPSNQRALKGFNDNVKKADALLNTQTPSAE